MKKTIVGILLAVSLLILLSTDGGPCRADQDAPIVGAYTVNNQIYINTLGAPEGKPLTTGTIDYKPVWSKSGSMLVFFRVKKADANLAEWKTAICVINTDGTGFRELTDGSAADFNPTWMRDGSNRIVFTRMTESGRRVAVYMTAPNSRIGEEKMISDPEQVEVLHSSLKDGRIFITSSREGGGAFMFALEPDGAKRYERVNFTFNPGGWIDRLSISPGENRVTYELNPAMKWNYFGHPIVIADFDPVSLTISNPLVIKESHNDGYNLYPRWTRDGSAVIYQSSRDGRNNQLYMYRLGTRQTTRVSTDGSADYGFFCGEETPW